MDAAKAKEFLFIKIDSFTASPPMRQGLAKALRRSVEIHFEAGAELGESVRGITSIDKEWDVKMRAFLPKSEIQRISAELRKRFGFSSLSATGDKISRRILKRGSIKNMEEAQALRDFLLSDGYAADALPKVSLAALEKLLADFEARLA